MELQGTINHVALSVSDLDSAMEFYSPLLEALGYTVGEPVSYKTSRLSVNVHAGNGTALNLWQATKSHTFDTYEPGLHHLAFNADSRSEVDSIHELALDLGVEILDGPGNSPSRTRVITLFICLGRTASRSRSCIWQAWRLQSKKAEQVQPDNSIMTSTLLSPISILQHGDTLVAA